MPRSSATKYFAALVDNSGKTHREIAEASGYKLPNIIAMMKMGATKIPIKKAASLAVAAGGDGAHLLRLVLEDHSPDNLAAIESCIGALISKNELAILQVIRNASRGRNPKATGAQQESLARLFE